MSFLKLELTTYDTDLVLWTGSDALLSPIGSHSTLWLTSHMAPHFPYSALVSTIWDARPVTSAKIWQSLNHSLVIVWYRSHRPKEDLRKSNNVLVKPQSWHQMISPYNAQSKGTVNLKLFRPLKKKKKLGQVIMSMAWNMKEGTFSWPGVSLLSWIKKLHPWLEW